MEDFRLYNYRKITYIEKAGPTEISIVKQIIKHIFE